MQLKPSSLKGCVPTPPKCAKLFVLFVWLESDAPRRLTMTRESSDSYRAAENQFVAKTVVELLVPLSWLSVNWGRMPEVTLSLVLLFGVCKAGRIGTLLQVEPS